MSDDTTLNADEFQALCLEDAILATDRYEALRAEVERLRTERAPQWTDGEIERQRADRAESEVEALRAEVEALREKIRTDALLVKQTERAEAALAEVERLTAERDDARLATFAAEEVRRFVRRQCDEAEGRALAAEARVAAFTEALRRIRDETVPNDQFGYAITIAAAALARPCDDAWHGVEGDAKP